MMVITLSAICESFDDLGFHEDSMKDCRLNRINFNCSPLSLWLLNFGVVPNGISKLVTTEDDFG